MFQDPGVFQAAGIFQDPGMLQDPDLGPGLDPDWISRTNTNQQISKMTRNGSPRVAMGRESVKMDRGTATSPNIPLPAPDGPNK